MNNNYSYYKMQYEIDGNEIEREILTVCASEAHRCQELTAGVYVNRYENTSIHNYCNFHATLKLSMDYLNRVL